MPWVTTFGTKLEFPYALWAKLARASKPNREDVMDALRETQRIHDEAVRLVSRVSDLEAEVTKLRVENEFMLRMIQEKD